MLSMEAGSIEASQAYLDCSQMRDWVIVVAVDAIPSEKYAAEEFQRWFDRATGLGLPVETSTEGGPHQIHIGSSSLPEGDPSADTAAMGEESFRIVVEKDRLAIFGGRPRGTLYGVYQFLEDLLPRGGAVLQGKKP